MYKAANITPSVYKKTKWVPVVGLETFLTETEMLKREKRNKCLLCTQISIDHLNLFLTAPQKLCNLFAELCYQPKYRSSPWRKSFLHQLSWDENTPSEFSTQNLSILLTVCHTFLMRLYLKSSCWINQQLKLIFYFLFVIFLFDRVLMLSSTITYWSLLSVKRLKEITYHCTTAAVEEEVTSIWTKRNLLDLETLNCI